MTKIIKNNQEKGFTLILSTTLILTISLIIISGLTSLTINSIINTRNKIKSTQSYYAAEAGIEDSLLRLKNSEMMFFDSNTLNIDNSLVNIEISELIGGARTITSQSNNDDIIRKLSAIFITTADNVSFFYGAQAGDGGITMGNGSKIEGNVFSNGSIIGNGEITETATVALNVNKIENVSIGKNAYAYICNNVNIGETLYYVSGGSIQNCNYGTAVNIGPDEIEPQDLPIPDEQITEWKDEATAGGIINNDYTISGGTTDSLGPIKITGNLSIDNNSTLNITGLVYVQGDITIDNNALVKLDESFGSISGVIISDGQIIVSNNVIIQGSGQIGSFLMFLSTNNSLDPSNPAIDVSNNAEAAIFYTSNGLIVLHNNVNIKEVTGYKIRLDNNAVISYETGLENVNFTSGPGGSWEVKEWKEIE
ncbi:hypothetical protein KKH35_00095 [Patescibacteria group bacterium]|nr:hypothetical protein [Patescibacteria group bacterium]